MEGPAFSTRAESVTNHKAGFDVIGMTNLGEARCAREAEIAILHHGDGHRLRLLGKGDGEHVTVDMVIENLQQERRPGQGRHRPSDPPDSQSSQLAVPMLRSGNAIMTDKQYWPSKVVKDCARCWRSISESSRWTGCCSGWKRRLDPCSRPAADLQASAVPENQ